METSRSSPDRVNAIEALIGDLKTKIIEGLDLEDTTAEEIDPDEPLFVEGLGLDSIDAVELVVILEKHYGILLTEMETAKAAFASLRTLARFILGERNATDEEREAS